MRVDPNDKKLSPMMRQYLLTKQKYNDAILFFRLGDFYEMFFEDAELCARILELTLTGKDCGLEKRAPMCGVPHHACEGYVAKLLENGYKVAICEQLTQPEKGVKVVERDVVRIITPGTLVDSYYDMLMSECRTTSLIAISRRQVTSKHWFALSRNLTKLDGYKGLVSWSGTAFEYFMPYMN